MLLAFPDINEIKNKIKALELKVYGVDGEIIDKEAFKLLSDLEKSAIVIN